MKNLLILIYVALMAILPIACDSEKGEDIKTPPVFTYALPQKAEIKSYVAIWEFPGLPPLDKNSDFVGYRGKHLGTTIEGEIEVSDYEWSDTDKGYYVYIVQGELKGWIPLEFVQLK